MTMSFIDFGVTWANIMINVKKNLVWPLRRSSHSL